MATDSATAVAPPEGFVLDSTNDPAPPEGFVLDSQQSSVDDGRPPTASDTAQINAADKARTEGREYGSDNTGLTTALAQPIMGGLKPNENPAKIALAIGGAPFALLDAALPHLTDEERKSLAKTSPGWEKTEAGAELLGKIAPFLIPMGAAAEGARGASTLGKIAGGAFGAGAATQLPETARQAGTVFGDPKSTAGQKILAGGELATTLGVAGLGLGGAALPKPPPTPPTLGETLAKRLNVTPAAHETFVDTAKVLPNENASAPETVPVQAKPAAVEGGTRPAIVETAPEVVPPTQSEAKAPTKEEDAAEYKNVQADMADLKKAPVSEMMTPEYGEKMMAVFKRMEEIKNRNTGYAPGTELQPEPEETAAGAKVKKPQFQSLDDIDASKLSPAQKVKARDAFLKSKGVKPPEEPSDSEVKQLPMGPGASNIQELPKMRGQGPGNPDIYGIAERVRDERAKAGQVAAVPPGEGISAPDSVDHGRALLASGANAESVLSNFEKTKRLSSDDMAIVRAHGEQLAKSARKIEEQFGTNSPEYKTAFDALSKWDARSKVMQTEWHKTGQAQQGETDLDTGTFTGLARAYKDSTGKDFTPNQSKEANEKASGVRKAEADADSARKRLYDEAEKSKPTKSPEKPAETHKPGTPWEPAQVRDLWKRARGYIDKGEDDFDSIRNKLATDLGLPVADVTRGMTQPRNVKRAADDVWMKQKKARALKSQAVRWLYAQSIPKWRAWFSSIPSGLFRLRIGLHGTVALGTHAPALAFQPEYWSTYAKNYGRMYRMVGSPTFHEIQVQDLVRRPNYILAQRAGLQNNPFGFEDYTSPDFINALERISPALAQKSEILFKSGDRGYSVLKMLRQDVFDQDWSKLPQSMQTPEMAAQMADAINHVTGVTQSKAPKGSNLAFFAPRLEASRAAWIFGDPYRAAKTGTNWKNATPEEKSFAIKQIKEKAWVLGTLGSLLALNQGLLSASGSKQKINMTDPTRSDFLKFKVAGMDFTYGNAMLTMARFPVRIGTLLTRQGGKLKNVVYPDEDVYSATGEYVRSQLSPIASLGADLASREDWQRRQLPSSNRPEPKRLRIEGITPYTWREFWSEQLLPIPFQEGAREVWRDGMKMSPNEMRRAEEAAASTAVNLFTGGRLTEDLEPVKKK